MKLENHIREVADFPKPGINFKDITPLLANPEAFNASISEFETRLSDLDFDVVVGPESRGFIFGVPLALKMNKSFVPVRKPGKLPYHVESVTYDLEYGTDTLEIHEDAVIPGQKVVIVDDLLATGGTVEATVKLLEKLGAQVVACAFLIELEFLKGKDKLSSTRVESLIKY